MARSPVWRVGAVAVAAGLLVAACSGGSGGPGAVDTNILPTGTNSAGAPTGIAGGSGSAHGSASNSKSAKASGSHTASRGSSSTPAHGASSSSRGGGGGGHSSSSAPPVDNGCRSSAPPAASDPSKASITVCKAVGLRPAATSDCPKYATPCVIVTITGHSFKPNEALVVAECRYKGENADNYGISDCNIKNLATFAPGTSTRSDASGNVGPISVPLVASFKTINCRTDTCLVSVAKPLASSAADNPHVLISFS